MVEFDVHVPSTTTFEPAPAPTGPDVRGTAPAPLSFYAHPCTFDYYNSTDPNLYSLSNPRAYSSALRPCTYAISATTTTNTTMMTDDNAYPRPQQQQQQQQYHYTSGFNSSRIPSATPATASSISSVSSTSSSIFSAASNTSLGSASSAASNPANTCELSSTDEEPCEKYRQFLHSSRQERTVVIGKLVDISAEIIDSIWHPRFLQDSQRQAKIMSTRNFIHEILKRSKTTYSTLQISLFYLFRVKKVVHERLVRRNNNATATAASAATVVLPPTPPSSQASDDDDDDDDEKQLQQDQLPEPPRKKQKRQVSERLDDIVCCGRRMFLASLMVASKYLHDKNYRNRAWAKISGLDIDEINAAELAFLRLIDYKLYVSKPTFDKWYTLLHGYVQKQQDGIAATAAVAVAPSNNSLGCSDSDSSTTAGTSTSCIAADSSSTIKTDI